MSRLGPCMCGACDCPFCGPAQGYTVTRRLVRGRWTWVNPEDDEEPELEPDRQAENDAADRIEREEP